jgi:hypothetical protein
LAASKENGEEQKTMQKIMGIIANTNACIKAI